jgi:pyrimidine operon attenuation protein / uracil phosphoribosyltransferase
VKIQLNNQALLTIIDELTDQLMAAYPDTANTVLIGIQQGGVVVSNLIHKALHQKAARDKINYKPFEHGQLDITFYRDDVRNKILAPDTMHLPFSVEGKTVILVDDVLFTGRTIKAALDALFDYGRPDRVKLCVLVDRPEHRQFPIQADHVGKVINTQRSDKLKLSLNNQGLAELLLVSE